MAAVSPDEAPCPVMLTLGTRVSRQRRRSFHCPAAVLHQLEVFLSGFHLAVGSDVAFPVPQFPRLQNKNVEIADLLGFCFSNAMNFDCIHFLDYYFIFFSDLLWFVGCMESWMPGFFLSFLVPVLRSVFTIFGIAWDADIALWGTVPQKSPHSTPLSPVHQKWLFSKLS